MLVLLTPLMVPLRVVCFSVLRARSYRSQTHSDTWSILSLAHPRTLRASVAQSASSPLSSDDAEAEAEAKEAKRGEAKDVAILEGEFVQVRFGEGCSEVERTKQVTLEEMTTTTTMMMMMIMLL